MEEEVKKLVEPLENIRIESQYKKGQLFSRTNAYGSDLGLSTWTGRHYPNCDGLVFIFNDGQEVLLDYCTVVTKASIQTQYAINRDLANVQKEYFEMSNAIISEGAKLTR